MFSPYVLHNYKEPITPSHVQSSPSVLYTGVRTEPRARAFRDYNIERIVQMSGKGTYGVIDVDNVRFRLHICEGYMELLKMREDGYFGRLEHV